MPGAFLNLGYADKRAHRYWHYKDVEFSPDGSELPEKPWINAETVIAVFRDTLAVPPVAGQDHPLDDIKSFDIAWLIHLVGDAHQPLHATERVTAGFPAGDTGGNGEQILTSGGKPQSLHAFWDSLLGETATPGEAIAAAASLAPADGARLKIKSPAAWFRESYMLARKYVYTGEIGDGTGERFALTPAYEEAAKKLAEAQAAVAGARLAGLLNEALK